MVVVIVLAIAIILVIAFILFIKYFFFKRYVLNNFKSCNVIVAGKKGTGKDLVFNYVINKRKEPYYANISYSEHTGTRLYKKIGLKEVSCEPNDYNAFVNNKIEKTPHILKEGANIYVSDIGVFLPSYMDSKLYVKFPSMPIFYALSRHLYNTNIHCNTQNLERGWKALREQADYYVRCLRTYKVFGLLITKLITYDTYESARKGLLPLKSRFLNKYSRAEVDIYNASNGIIKTGHIIQRKSNIHYDTRAFEKICLKGPRKY